MTPILQKRFDHWARSAHGPDYKTKLPAFQLQETERAFMSGFASYYFFSMEMTALSDDACEAKLRELNQEIQDYFKQFKSMARHPDRN